MRQGKLTNKQLKKTVLSKIKSVRPEVLLRPGIGEDCGAVDLQGQVCVLSTDPITSAINDAGTLAVNVSCNDVASCGAEPVALLATILAPPSATLDEIEGVISQMAEAAEALNVEIVGGHTEVTTAVNRIVVVTTVVGRCARESLITTAGARPGDDIVMTKSAGLEGTAIIASDVTEAASILNADELAEAKSMGSMTSVVKEGLIAAKHGATAMHDITEGGVFGAVWELAQAAKAGAVINKAAIPVAKVTEKICAHFGINPYRLLSSGAMLICVPPENTEAMVAELAANGTAASVIGKITQEREIVADGEAIAPPGADEITKLF